MWRRLAAGLVDASSVFGLIVFVTGGYWLRSHGKGLGFDLNLTWYGPFFWPLAICLLAGWRPGGFVLPALERGVRWFGELPARVQQIAVGSSLAVLTAAHSCAVYFRYITFQAGMDLAIYANACRNGLFSTMKGDVWLFADHFEPVLALFTPLCERLDPALVLLMVQELAFGLGAAGIYALARGRDWSPAAAWLIAVLYLGFAGNVSIAYYDFHLLALALGVVPWLWWSVEVERYTLACLLALFFLGLKESTALSLAGLGAYWLLVGPNAKRRILGGSFLVAGAATFIVIMKVVYPAFRHGEETMYFAKYYGHLGANLGEFLTTILTRPFYFLSTLATVPKFNYMVGLLAPFLFLPLIRPQYLIPIAPALLINIASNDTNLLSLIYHYEAEIYPALFATAVIAFGMGSLRLRNAWLAGLLLLFSAPSATATVRRHQPNSVQKRLQAQLEQHVPKGVAVAAPQRIAAHLTRIPRLYMFDYWKMEQDWKRADVVVVGYPGDRLGWYVWPVLEYLKLPRMMPMLRPIYQDPNDPHFRVYEVLHDHREPLTQR